MTEHDTKPDTKPVTKVVCWLLLGLVRLLVGAHARWLGCAPEPVQRLYFANHTSHLDALVIMAALPPPLRRVTHPVAALDYWGRSRLHRFLAADCLGAVLVDRSLRPAGDPLRPLAHILADGRSLLIFPEGTRGSGEIGPFRAGLFHLARRFPTVELVPVYLENLQRVLPKGSPLIVPLICTLRFGAPLALEPDESKPAFLARARAALAGLTTAAEAGEDRAR